MPAPATKKKYRIYSGSLQDKFDSLRTKIQFYGGGYGNGKTSAAVVLRVLMVARDYPGANILVARETFPKLNDTIRKEFIKWCPKHWIKSFPMSANGSNTCTLINGTMINFRYIAQQGKSNEESSTSNLLSATYDLIVVDQVEDPGIEYKDFIDLLGRLRGDAVYVGDDETMPKTGPRWMVLTSNPTRNWVFKRIVKPLFDYIRRGVIVDDLLCERDADTDEPVLDENGKPNIIIGLVEGSTYENKENLSDDFIKTLEATYRGTMKSRFLRGEWGAFEGLIYADFDAAIHGIDRGVMEHYLDNLLSLGYMIRWKAGYDYGIAKPSCFLLAFIDPNGNVCVLDGYHKAEMSVFDQRKQIGTYARQRGITLQPANRAGARLIPYADPSIFRRGPGGAKVVGKTVADMFNDAKETAPRIMMQRGNNEIINGITKVQQFLAVHEHHYNPFIGAYGAPHFYYANDLEFIEVEATDYIWKPAPATSVDERGDAPRDGNDHAMDATKYLLSHESEPSRKMTAPVNKIPLYRRWHEAPDTEPQRATG